MIRVGPGGESARPRLVATILNGLGRVSSTVAWVLRLRASILDLQARIGCGQGGSGKGQNPKCGFSARCCRRLKCF